MAHPSQKYRNRINLSRQELYGISEAIRRNFEPRFSNRRIRRKSKSLYSSQELLEISRQISKEYAPRLHHNRPTLVLQAVSPTRLHLYWHTALPIFENGTSNKLPLPKVLRIFTETEEPATTSSPIHNHKAWLDIAIDDMHGHMDIDIPESSPGLLPQQYRAVLGEIQGDQSFKPLIFSNRSDSLGSMPAPGADKLTNGIAQSIIEQFHSASSTGPTASGQGK